MAKISVCIPTVRPDTLASAIRSVLKQTETDWELVVVGQGEESVLRNVVDAAAAGDPRIRYVHLNRRGASIARNAAINATSSALIAFVDDDCEAREDWLSVLCGCFESNPELGLVGGSLLAPRPANKLFAVCPTVEPDEVLYDPVLQRGQPPAGWVWVTANFAIRRDVADRVGPLDELLGAGTHFAAAEDTDYLLRLEGLGIKMLTTPRAIVYHTYGYRYGFKAVYQHKRNYARGNGALAAKLTLLGDPRGREWVRGNIYEATLGRARSLRAYELPASLWRLWHFLNGYREFVVRYRARFANGSQS